MKKLLNIAICASLLLICSACGNSQQESFWEGRVKPGTYTGSYLEGNGLCRSIYELVLTIEDNHDIELRKTEKSSCGRGESSTKIFYGHINKYVETYNGERKVWYGVSNAKQDGGVWVTDFNISTSMEYSKGDETTYQNFSMRNKEFTFKFIN